MPSSSQGVPPPFVVARHENSLKVLNEAIKYAGLFDRLEELLQESGKRREMFEIACKVDFGWATRSEEEPVSYVDPRLVTHLFDQLLDRGFRLLRVVESRNEIARYHRKRSVEMVGRAIGYDEQCYELRDLSEELFPVPYGGALGTLATGKIWREADCRMVFAKNRTHELFGPCLCMFNVFGTLASPTGLIALGRGLDPVQYVLGSLQETPVHFALIDAIYSRDGSPGTGGPFALLTDPEGGCPEGPALLRTDTILAGQDVLAVESAGMKMQGVDPLQTEVFKTIRRSTGYQPPEEVLDLPQHPGWQSLGNQIREILDVGSPVEAYRLSVQQALTTVDEAVFPPQPGAWQRVRLQRQVEEFLDQVRRKRGMLAVADSVD